MKKVIDVKALEKVISKLSQDTCESVSKYRSVLVIDQSVQAFADEIESLYEYDTILRSLLESKCKKTLTATIYSHRYNEVIVNAGICPFLWNELPKALIRSAPNQYVSVKSATIPMFKEAMFRSLKNRKSIDVADDKLQDRTLQLIRVMELNNCGAEKACEILIDQLNASD